MAKTNVRGTQIADGSSGVDLTVDVFGVLPTANGGVAAGGSAGQFYRQDKTWQTLLLSDVPDAWTKRSVRAASTANLTVASAVINGAIVDGITMATGDRILLKNQTAPAENGIYVVVASGAASRATDADTASEIAGGVTNVDSGTANGGKTFKTTFKSTDTLGTTSMTWAALLDTAAAVDLTSAQTLTNKTLTGPKIDVIKDGDGDSALGILTNAGVAVNYLEIRNTIAGSFSPVLAAVGTDTNLNINLTPKGTGKIQAGGIEVATISATQTLTNKTLTAPKVDQLNESVNGLKAVEVTGPALAVNYVRLIGQPTGATPSVGVGGSDTDIGMNLFSKGAGGVFINGVTAVTTTGSAALSNKTLSGAVTVGTATTDITGAWTAYTPVGGVGLTVGNGTWDAAWMQMGKTTFVRVLFTLGTTSAITGAITITLPATQKSLTNGAVVLAGHVQDTSALAPGRLPAAAVSNGSGLVGIYTQGGSLSASVPFTWASTDVIAFSGVYEAA